MSGRSTPVMSDYGMISGDWNPTVETVGYDGMSLRDKNMGVGRDPTDKSVG